MKTFKITYPRVRPLFLRLDSSVANLYRAVVRKHGLERIHLKQSPNAFADIDENIPYQGGRGEVGAQPTTWTYRSFHDPAYIYLHNIGKENNFRIEFTFTSEKNHWWSDWNNSLRYPVWNRILLPTWELLKSDFEESALLRLCKYSGTEQEYDRSQWFGTDEKISTHGPWIIYLNQLVPKPGVLKDTISLRKEFVLASNSPAEFQSTPQSAAPHSLRTLDVFEETAKFLDGITAALKV